MKENEICRTCIYFPCTKPQCEINRQGCNDYESISEAEIRKGVKNEKGICNLQRRKRNFRRRH